MPGNSFLDSATCLSSCILCFSERNAAAIAAGEPHIHELKRCLNGMQQELCKCPAGDSELFCSFYLMKHWWLQFPFFHSCLNSHVPLVCRNWRAWDLSSTLLLSTVRSLMFIMKKSNCMVVFPLLSLMSCKACIEFKLYFAIILFLTMLSNFIENLTKFTERYPCFVSVSCLNDDVFKLMCLLN